MYSSPHFGGCKYTNNFLFINKNIEIQRFGLLITCRLLLTLTKRTTLWKPTGNG